MEDNHKMVEKTCLLIDGMNYLYRSFYVSQAKKYENNFEYTLKVMIKMINALIRKTSATHVACVFDAKGEKFRKKIFPAYKANRRKMPDELKKQIPIIIKMIKVMGWRVIMIDKLEADDVIGTISKTLSDQEIKVFIASADKDLTQLVNKNVTLLDSANGKVRDVQGVLAEFGVPPSSMVEYQMLVGDTADNIPGVHKVGPKTAARWLNEYGSLKNIIKHSLNIKGEPGENLRSKSKSDFDLTRALVTLKTNCDFKEHVPSLMGNLSYLEQTPFQHIKFREICMSYKISVRSIQNLIVSICILKDGSTRSEIYE